jgi:hypothetical protein
MNNLIERKEAEVGVKCSFEYSVVGPDYDGNIYEKYEQTVRSERFVKGYHRSPLSQNENINTINLAT